LGQRVDLPGSAHLVLAGPVAYLDPAPAVFDAMVTGWSAQQRSRFLTERTVAARVWVVRRFAGFTGLYPWQWKPAEVEAFTVSLLAAPRPAAHSTVRNYQDAIRLFCGYLTDARYGWVAECQRRFGEVPAQVCHEWNTVGHLAEVEGRAGRRALTFDEVQQLFEALEARAGEVILRGRKGVLAALRDAALLKTIYAFGLRRREAAMLDVADLRRNPRMPGYGMFGSVHVRYGKAVKGSPPRRRMVLTVPEMDWVVGLLTEWVEQLRPALGPGGSAALWVTERRSRISGRRIDEVFAEARERAGLPGELDLHCLRHSYVSHLIEFGYPALFVQQQAGHAVASTTAIYTSVSDEFRNRLLEQAIGKQRQAGRTS